jgi:hypothetical protein
MEARRRGDEEWLLVIDLNPLAWPWGHRRVRGCNGCTETAGATPGEC